MAIYATVTVSVVAWMIGKVLKMEARSAGVNNDLCILVENEDGKTNNKYQRKKNKRQQY